MRGVECPIVKINPEKFEMTIALAMTCVYTDNIRTAKEDKMTGYIDSGLSEINQCVLTGGLDRPCSTLAILKYHRARWIGCRGL